MGLPYEGKLYMPRKGRKERCIQTRSALHPSKIIMQPRQLQMLRPSLRQRLRYHQRL